jgi:hypothetical protein
MRTFVTILVLALVVLRLSPMPAHQHNKPTFKQQIEASGEDFILASIEAAGHGPDYVPAKQMHRLGGKM